MVGWFCRVATISVPIGVACVCGVDMLVQANERSRHFELSGYEARDGRDAALRQWVALVVDEDGHGGSVMAAARGVR